MTYNAITDRSEAGPLIPEDAAREIISAATEKSFALSVFDRVPMSRKQKRLPILDRKPLAYWVNGDTGLKQTSDLRWDNIFLNAEELAVLIPISDLVADDADYDIWGLVKPQVTEAMAAAVDDAVLFGNNKPSLWPTGIVPATATAGNQVTGATASATHDIFDDLNQALGLLEADGFNPTDWLLRQSMRGVIRNTRDSQRGFLYPTPTTTGAQDAAWRGEVWGLPAQISRLGLSGFSAGATNTVAVAVDRS